MKKPGMKTTGLCLSLTAVVLAGCVIPLPTLRPWARSSASYEVIHSELVVVPPGTFMKDPQTREQWSGVPRKDRQELGPTNSYPFAVAVYEDGVRGMGRVRCTRASASAISPTMRAGARADALGAST